MAPPQVIEEEEEEGTADAKVPVRLPGRLRVLHPDVMEFLRSPVRLRVAHPKRPTPPSSPRAVAQAEESARARYDCAFEEDEVTEGFTPPRLVWGKVKNHPWWPGQVFDAADASELARRQQRGRGAVLVAYFWDKSFAWTDPAALRPFRAGFQRFAAQNSLATFAAAVDTALDEVARRVDVGLSCGCRGNTMKQQVVDNAGVRDGACGAVVDAVSARRAFRDEALVGYISALATAPLAGAERVDLTIATAQLKAFSRWRGTRGLPEYTYFNGIDGVAMKAAPARAKKRTSKSGGDGRGKKMSRCSRARENNAACESVDDAMELQDMATFSEPTSSQMTTKMGILMNRAAKQMSLSPVVLRANGNPPDVDVVPQHMERCTSIVDELLPPVNNGAQALKDDKTCKVMPVGDQAGLLLNFSSASVVPSISDLTLIFRQFGPIKEAIAENSTALVVFKRRAHAEEAFARTARLRAISASLTSYRLTHSPPPATAPTDPPMGEQRGRGCPGR